MCSWCVLVVSETYKTCRTKFEKYNRNKNMLPVAKCRRARSGRNPVSTKLYTVQNRVRWIQFSEQWPKTCNKRDSSIIVTFDNSTSAISCIGMYFIGWSDILGAPDWLIVQWWLSGSENCAFFVSVMPMIKQFEWLINDSGLQMYRGKFVFLPAG